ncbi:MAG: hypothetical protein J2P59_08010 [Acidimicrobiales bacterium]|nr:hypothetical protein [Acidimicrobiales bacterium]
MVPAPSAQELIGTVLADAADETPLARLQTAASVTKAVGETADAVLGYFVDQARRAGHSWSEIGESLGVSKQAVQQRHGARPGPFPVTLERFRFTDRARRVIEQSEFAARHLGHGFVGTEHLLLAQYGEPDGVGAVVLAESGLSADAVREAVLERIGQGPGAGEGALPYTPRALQLLHDALNIAVDLGHNYVGTEHLLVAAAGGGGVAANVLQGAGLDEAILRAKITARLAGVAPETSTTKKGASSSRDRAPKRARSGRSRRSS